ncbi:VacJ family lipoprotein [Fusobacterium canifelinum]|uniref:VacJ family lipoprotein n=1 Tax=Fusobacterium canifelinum TaxID=285729 RepID=A0A3P1UTR2_9FUSO|nr:MlaA family lipoprotein [Fusobacterium canifelinum]QQB74804.1 VacJ family lipoprotein [Fusobacterium canifelinum]RRD25232.1 VacJ family lipoprotein [Fusobacterium canifelinum]
MKIKKLLLLSVLSLTLISCSNTSQVNTSNTDYTEASNVVYANPGESNFMADEPDPWEPFNRRMYYFNYQIERLLITPIVNTYKFITPDFVEDRVSNFFKNAKVLNTMANSAFQFKGRKSMRALGRFTINTVLGLGGLFDVASKMGMPKPHEDFGLTLAHYGVGRGPYLILPILGPTYLRDAFGMAVDGSVAGKVDIYHRMSLFNSTNAGFSILRGIDMRKNIDFHYHQTNSPFEYEYVRYLYSKYRGIQEAASKQ